MRETTSSEFVDWQIYFEQDINMPKREDYYLAQIAAEIRRTISKAPSAVHAKYFMLKFTTAAHAKKSLTRAEIEQQTKNSKARWLAFARLPVRMATQKGD